jgi:hypothetical protein
MNKLEAELVGLALMAIVDGVQLGRTHVSPAILLEAVLSRSGVHSEDIKIEVSSKPDDFFIRFRSSDDCSRVLHSCQRLDIGGRTVILRRWHRGVSGAVVT